MLSKVFRTYFLGSLRFGWPAYLLVLAAFAAGVIAGASGVERLSAEQSTSLSYFLDRFVFQSGSIEIDPVLARDALYNDTAVILAFYVLGLTVIGIPVLLGLVFFRGFILGFAVNYLTVDRPMQGLVIILAAILPQNLFLVPAILIGGAASLSFSMLLARRFLDSRFLIWPGFTRYSGMMAAILGLASVAALVEVYLTPSLLKLAANYFF
ncbi:MAG: stage II sporulation protein M [Eubacteriales bacterium]